MESHEKAQSEPSEIQKEAADAIDFARQEGLPLPQTKVRIVKAGEKVIQKSVEYKGVTSLIAGALGLSAGALIANRRYRKKNKKQ